MFTRRHIVSASLAQYLSRSIERNSIGFAVKDTIICLSQASKNIAYFLSKNGLLNNQMGSQIGNINVDGDSQKALDVIADKAIIKAIADKDVAAYFSEEQDTVLLLEQKGNLIVCADPLDGSSNIDNNISVGTIFSILPRKNNNYEIDHITNDVLQPGVNQLASGFFMYGPQTTLILTIGNGVAAFVLDNDEFFLMEWKPKLSQSGNQFAINMSNMRFWSQKARDYIHQCLDGEEGNFAKNYNMRWCGSLVADAWRIFREGGIFLYPEDSRKNYDEGRLRLIYEANPIAFLVEQAGGRASNGQTEILSIKPNAIHQRVPLIFGSKRDVANYENQ